MMIPWTTPKVRVVTCPLLPPCIWKEKKMGVSTRRWRCKEERPLVPRNQ